jgi:heme-degrading monooxygenase HmoA
MAEVNFIEWHVTPFRRDRFLEIWLPALDRALAFGARSCFLTRNQEDPLHLRQVSVWESHADFERYWASDEISALRQEAMQYFHKPVYPVWHTLLVDTTPPTSSAGASDVGGLETVT